MLSSLTFQLNVSQSDYLPYTLKRSH